MMQYTCFVCCFLVVFMLGLSMSGFSPEPYSLCQWKDFGFGSGVCVCTESSCDSFGKPGEPLGKGQYAVYTSSKTQYRFHLEVKNFSKTGEFHTEKAEGEDEGLVLTVDRKTKFQKIMGFGGAFTDAATLNIMKLTPTLRSTLLASYYSPNGTEYNFGRVPMASCDFSSRVYTYDDIPGDFPLKHFALAKEDTDFKIPAIKMAQSMSKRDILLYGSPWSGPAWLKTNNSTHGFGQLIGKAGDKYHKTWAMYFVRFLNAYAKLGVNFWGLTVENEPTAGYVPGYSFQCMGFTAAQERDFVKMDLGPTLHATGYSNITLMMLDDQRLFIESWAKTILSDPDAAKFITGIGVHWYMDDYIPPVCLTNTHNLFPDYFILATEACNGDFDPKGPALGSWSRGEKYSHSVIEDFSHWVTGWVDWNLALDLKGGPNWVNNVQDAAIIVDVENNLFYKQPMYYHLGHFSKFVLPGSTRIALESSEESPLEYIAFERQDGVIVVVVLNRATADVPVQIKDPLLGIINTSIPASSIQTYIWGGDN